LGCRGGAPFAIGFPAHIGILICCRHHLPALHARATRLRTTEFAIRLPKFSLSVFFGEPFMAGRAREAFLVVNTAFSLNAFSNEDLRAFDALVSIAHYRMARFTVRLFLIREIARLESNFAFVTPEAALMPEMSYNVGHLSAERFFASSALIVRTPVQVSGLTIATVHAIRFPIISFHILAFRDA